MNEVLSVAMLIVNFASIMIAFRLWGKKGILIWMPISVIIANIQVTKNISVLGFDATLGNIVYATSFLCTDILSEFYGKKDATNAVYMGFFSMIVMTLMMQLAIMFPPASSDIVQQHLVGVFALMPRIALASVIAYLISNLLDVNVFDFLKRKTKALWIRNNIATILSQIIDSIIFNFLAFYKVYETKVVLNIIITTLILKGIIALLDTPFFYLANFWVKKGKIEDLR